MHAPDALRSAPLRAGDAGVGRLLEKRSMTLQPSIEHIQHLLRPAQTEEARTELVNLLRREPRNDQAWAIASQLTSERQQRKEFLKKVFDYSSNTALADWAFRSLGQLTNELIEKNSAPPMESLVVPSDTKISLDDLLIQVTNQIQSAPLPANEIPSMAVRGNDLSAPPVVSQTRQTKRNLLPFSVKELGKWIMLGAGLLFISTVYFEPLLQLFVYIGISPFFYCFVPLFSAGVLIMIVGFFIERK